jgi:hypothetical protein
MRHQQQGPLLPGPFQPGDDVGPVLLERQDLDRNPLLLENPPEIVGGRRLVSGRIAGIEPEELLEMTQRFRFEPRPVGL